MCIVANPVEDAYKAARRQQLLTQPLPVIFDEYGFTHSGGLEWNSSILY